MSSTRLPEEMVFGPGLQECCALLALGRGGVGTAARQSEQSRKAQGMRGEQQVVGSDWLVGSQAHRVKSGQVVKSLRAGPALEACILLYLWNVFKSRSKEGD